jgi:serine/threonine-protein kinase RsbW
MREPVEAQYAPGETPAIVRVSIPAAPEWVGVARLAAAGIASRLNFSIEDIEDLKLAVAEACTCCIQTPGGDEIRLACELYADRITITVQRDAVGIKTGARRSAEEALSEFDGLGVFLIRALMDDVTYEADTNAGTRLRLTKYLGS